MRFFSDGPSIPDILLERRDQGRVVFLCGAGVSFSSGLPGFSDLTNYVIDFFDPPKDSDICQAFSPWIDGGAGPKVPLDQIFHLLYQEYGRDEVNALVAKRLVEIKPNADSGREHELIKRLSKSSDGSPQIVTTNFDLLFELGDLNIPVYVPPAFPDLDLGMPLEGITYLHGRLKEPEEKHHPYILSSADFGRAYLAEGWATNFILKLLKLYTVVLVGYQAEDPQVKYLLQGLNHDEQFDRSKIFAFDKGISEDIEAKWRDRGVTAIAYSEHSKLWETLAAWADRADDPRKWRRQIIELAQRNPRELHAYNRGKVAHIIKTTAGARAFAEAVPSPSPEWLCVFDAYIRTTEKKSDYGNTETFDPLLAYGLDYDPPRQTEAFPKQLVHEHLLDWQYGDQNSIDGHRLGSNYSILPPRKWHLVRWIINNLNSPITAWWAVRQNGLHPRLIEEIQRTLWIDSDIHPEARKVWHLILDYSATRSDLYKEHAFYMFTERVKNEGWTPSVLRLFELKMAPYVEICRPIGLAASKPPLHGWESTSLGDLGEWEVKFPMLTNLDIEVPQEQLLKLLRILQSQLHRANDLRQELDQNYYVEKPTCYPDRIERDSSIESHSVFYYCLQIFKKLIESAPEQAKSICLSWSLDESLYFKKLKLFAFKHLELFEGEEVLYFILKIEQDFFWGDESRRELLFLLRDRWKDLTEEGKNLIAERILNGPDYNKYWSEEEYPLKRDWWACQYSKWLMLNGVTFPISPLDKLECMLSQFPDWDDRGALTLSETNNIKCYSVSSDESPDQIINAPVFEVIEQAKAVHSRELGSRTQKRPFTGLVKRNPRKALASLSYLARKGEYPQEYWTALLDQWPKETPLRLLRVLLMRLGQLPNNAISSFNYAIGRWIQRHILIALKADREMTWRTFDHIVSGLMVADWSASKSTIGDIYSGGKRVQRSRRTYDHAINSTVGSMVQGLLAELNARALQENTGISSDIRTRLERLTEGTEESADHAVIIITHEIGRLYYIDSQWVKSYILQWFELGHHFLEPAWHGFISRSLIPQEELSCILKPMFLGLFPIIYEWSWDSGALRVASQMVVDLSLITYDGSDRFTPSEARICLRNMRDSERQSAIHHLSAIGRRNSDRWYKDVIPFINSVWPRERKFRTAAQVSAWINLLKQSDKAFPHLLKEMRWCLVPVNIERHWLHALHRNLNMGEPLAAVFPTDVLELCDLVIPNEVEDVSYDLKQVLELIEQSEPYLSGDKRFIRLINIIESR